MATDWNFFGGTSEGADGKSLGWQANPDFLSMLAQAGAGFSQGKGAGEALGGPVTNALKMRALQGNNPQPVVTPKGQKGLDDYTETIKHTADGVKRTTTSTEPSEMNLNTYGTSVSPESMKGGVSEQSPFWKALLGQVGSSYKG